MEGAVEQSWPRCKCGNEVDPRRVDALKGEVRCMVCPPPPLNVMMVDCSKSNLIITTDPSLLIGGLARHFTQGRSEPKENGQYMRLAKKLSKRQGDEDE